MIVIGIDPGLTGACALCDDGRLADVFDMPVSGKEVDAAVLADRLGEWLGQTLEATGDMPHAFVERQQAYPGQGVSTSFQTGRRFGVVLGVIAALDIPMTLVSPAKWKAATKTPKDKDGARARASQLMPGMSKFWSLKKNHGRAEAALIAWYGATILVGRTADENREAA